MFSRTRLFFARIPRPVYIGLAAIILLYYPIGMALVHSVNDDPAFNASTETPQGGSATVRTLIALLDREVNHTQWTPNEPFFMPGSLLTRMPAYQRGEIAAIARFTLALAEQLGRARGSSAMDPDLQKAIGFLNYPPDVWMYNPEVSRWLPTSSSEANYRSGREAFILYENRLEQGRAVFERRSDNLLETLERIASDLGSASAAVEAHMQEHTTFAFAGSAELFYLNKGKLYVYYLIMRDLEKDFAELIRERQLTTVWAQAMESLRTGAELSHLIVFNASPNSFILPNHLASQGFYLMRARTEIREITNILLK